MDEFNNVANAIRNAVQGKTSVAFFEVFFGLTRGAWAGRSWEGCLLHLPAVGRTQVPDACALQVPYAHGPCLPSTPACRTFVLISFRTQTPTTMPSSATTPPSCRPMLTWHQLCGMRASQTTTVSYGGHSFLQVYAVQISDDGPPPQHASHNSFHVRACACTCRERRGMRGNASVAAVSFPGE